MRHDLKCWPEPFAALLDGRKTHEVRVNDRWYALGDTLNLREWYPAHLPQGAGYTGRHCLVEVTYITFGGDFGLPDNLCVMSIRRIKA